MNILERIFQRKREQLVEAQRRVSLEEMKRRSADAPPIRGFASALRARKQGPALIAEVKKASPVKGVLREEFHPEEIARAYERAGADAMSVLTDVEFFQGAPEYLEVCREATSLPVIRKDFTLDEYDVYEARALGADAILLIAHGLEWSKLFDLHQLARSLGMDALVETHTAEEAARAVEFGAPLIGVNNRDLKTFEVRLETSEQILPTLPEGTIGVAESAIGSHQDVRRLADCGASAVLIGSTFSRATDIEAKVREVMGWTSR